MKYKKEQMTLRKDPLTGETFLPSRISQKFASPENRILYHNQKANKLRQSKMYIDNPIRKNLKILTELLETKTIENFHKQFLLGKGFTFGVLTHFDLYQEKRHPCIYEFIVVNQPNDQVQVVKIKPRSND